jgi:polyhydroxyalkanoate synthase subunit PhaC
VTQAPDPQTRADAERSLGVPTGLESIDAVGIARSFTRAVGTAPLRPIASARALGRHAVSLMDIAARVGRHAVTGHSEPVVTVPASDRRFTHRAWRDNVGYFALEQLYLAHCNLLRELVGDAGLTPHAQFKADFGASLVSDALAPTNFAITNPAVIERAYETGGRSVARGLRFFAEDVLTNDGLPRKVDTDAFELGINLAATPGDVVYRNELIELIQYRPTTPTVRDVPLLMCPPWINRYYIVDLSPGRSLVEWAVTHGMTVFAISYRNPDTSMADTTFADYLHRGILAAIEVVRAVTGSDQVNTLSVCLGGTLTVTLLAELANQGEGNLVKSATLLNSLTDHEGAGALGAVFTDERTVASIERTMARRGYLEAQQLSRAFDLLRANDLLFRPLVSAWLMGDDPPAFDLLAWNAHATRLPRAMHSFYLRHFWLENDLAKGNLALDGEALSPAAIKTDAYIVGAEEDHIVPWTSSYRTTQLLGSDSRFVLSSGGHVAGIVNPPSPKARMWVADECPPDPQQWRAHATEVGTTWWEDWLPWIIDRSGAERPAPTSPGNEVYPALTSAPGEYVQTD